MKDYFGPLQEDEEFVVHIEVGSTYGSWKVLEAIGRFYKVQCKCGNIKIRHPNTLSAIHVQQCLSCYKKSDIRKKFKNIIIKREFYVP